MRVCDHGRLQTDSHVSPAAAGAMHDMAASAFTPALPTHACERRGLHLTPTCERRGLASFGDMALPSVVVLVAPRPSMRRGSLALAASGSTAAGNARRWQIMGLCALGCALGLYALHVGTMANSPPPVGRSGAAGFRAWCDFSVGASCSSVARSQYGVGLGIIKARGPFGFLALPNALYGVMYYVAMFVTQLPGTFSVARARQIALLLSGSALLGSVWLGFLLTFVIKNLCVVCVATYAVNGALFKLSLKDYNAFLQGGSSGVRVSEALQGGKTASGDKMSVGARAKGLVKADREARGEKGRAAAMHATSPGAGLLSGDRDSMNKQAGDSMNKQAGDPSETTPAACISEPDMSTKISARSATRAADVEDSQAESPEEDCRTNPEQTGNGKDGTTS